MLWRLFCSAIKYFSTALIHCHFSTILSNVRSTLSSEPLGFIQAHSLPAKQRVHSLNDLYCMQTSARRGIITYTLFHLITDDRKLLLKTPKDTPVQVQLLQPFPLVSFRKSKKSLRLRMKLMLFTTFYRINIYQ